ncbi:helix-turn-helix domain-containing protein [Nocardia rhizosphaerae]|uniref:Helix-turn-helix domain-containing protein n=1 Tax=Nocardia rhizosphaerae TaxID=1691571 RepID=A0ABV8LE22_9NOCA
MTNPVNQAREALGLQLRELRRDADLTARRLASIAGWHESKVSRIEYGKQTPSEADLRAWCEHTGHISELPDLIAALRNIEAAYMEWKRVLGIGTRRRQKMSVKLEGGARTIRWYEPTIVPGLLQTAEYAAGILSKIISFYEIPDDLADGVAARMERQRVLYKGDRRFSFIIAEQVLHTTVGDDQVMLGQFDRLLTVMSLPRVVLGIVPAAMTYNGPATNGFSIFDQHLVQVETVTAELSVKQPREIALYERMFAVLNEQAVFGERARELISNAAQCRHQR